MRRRVTEYNTRRANPNARPWGPQDGAERRREKRMFSLAIAAAFVMLLSAIIIPIITLTGGEGPGLAVTPPPPGQPFPAGNVHAIHLNKGAFNVVPAGAYLSGLGTPITANATTVSIHDPNPANNTFTLRALPLQGLFPVHFLIGTVVPNIVNQNALNIMQNNLSAQNVPFDAFSNNTQQFIQSTFYDAVMNGTAQIVVFYADYHVVNFAHGMEQGFNAPAFTVTHEARIVFDHPNNQNRRVVAPVAQWFGTTPNTDFAGWELTSNPGTMVTVANLPITRDIALRAVFNPDTRPAPGHGATPVPQANIQAVQTSAALPATSTMINMFTSSIPSANTFVGIIPVGTSVTVAVLPIVNSGVRLFPAYVMITQTQQNVIDNVTLQEISDALEVHRVGQGGFSIMAGYRINITDPEIVAMITNQTAHFTVFYSEYNLIEMIAGYQMDERLVFEHPNNRNRIIIAPPVPPRPSATFVTWEDTRSPGVRADFSRPIRNRDVTLRAVWSDTQMIIPPDPNLLIRLSHTDNLDINGTFLVWDNVPAASGYRIYLDNVAIAEVSHREIFNLATLSLGQGDYIVTIRVLGDLRLNNHSLVSDVLSFEVTEGGEIIVDPDPGTGGPNEPDPGPVDPAVLVTLTLNITRTFFGLFQNAVVQTFYQNEAVYLNEVRVPVQSGFTFRGWATSQEAAEVGRVTFSERGRVIMTDDIPLWAVWEAQHDFLITFHLRSQIHNITAGPQQMWVRGTLTSGLDKLPVGIALPPGIVFRGWALSQAAAEAPTPVITFTAGDPFRVFGHGELFAVFGIG